MTPENKRIVQQIVKLSGSKLEGKLPPVFGLQKRNPWAHLWDTIGRSLGRSYKDCDDSDVAMILSIVRDEVKLIVSEEELNQYSEEIKNIVAKSLTVL